MKCACVITTVLLFVAAAFPQAPSPAITQVFAFYCNQDFTSCPYGFDPTLAPIQLADGNLYGVTWWAGQGSSNNGGTVFRATLSGQASVVHTFLQAPNGSFPFGANPVLGFAKGPDGFLYGTTESGGAHGFGVMYKASTTGISQVLYNFCSLPGCPDGPGPLFLASDGNFYGAENHTIFRITPRGVWSLVHSMNPFIQGIGTTLMQASDGNFYGTGRIGSAGTVFRVTPQGQFTLLHTFPACLPTTSSLIQASDGNLYGGTSGSGSGTGIFRLSLSGNFEFIHQMTDSEGFGPVQLLQASDGNLWGLSDFRDGSFFAITLGGTSITSGAFSCNTTGCTPQGMVQGSDRNFYGTAISGGSAPGQHPEGTVFKIAGGLSQ